MAKPKALDQIQSEKERARHSLHRNSTGWSVWRTERSIWRKANAPSVPMHFFLFAVSGPYTGLQLFV